jgi:hypothetical protein
MTTYISGCILSVSRLDIIRVKYVLNVTCKQKWWICIYCFLTFFRKWNKRFLQSRGCEHVRIFALCIHFLQLFIQTISVFSITLCVYVCAIILDCACMPTYIHTCIISVYACYMLISICSRKPLYIFFPSLIYWSEFMWELWFPQQQKPCWWSVCCDTRQLHRW